MTCYKLGAKENQSNNYILFNYFIRKDCFIMKIENLHEGMVIKNYKELCSLLEIEVFGGNQKKSQMKDLETYCKFHKEGQKIIIDEIYAVQKEKVDNRENGAYDEMKSLILSILLLDDYEDNRAILPIGTLLNAIGAVSRNYSATHQYQQSTSEYLNMDVAYVNDFYDTTHKNLQRTLERKLNKLQDGSFIFWGKTVMICKNNVSVKFNKLGEYELDENGNVVSTVHKDYRLATTEEKEIILETERKYLDEFGYDDIEDVYNHCRSKEFYGKVERDLRRKYNINHYFKAYDIVFSRYNIERELTKIGFDYYEAKAKLNATVKENILTNAENRVKRAKKAVNTEPKNVLRRNDDFLDNMKKLIDVAINMSAKSISDEIYEIENSKKEKNKAKKK